MTPNDRPTRISTPIAVTAGGCAGRRLAHSLPREVEGRPVDGLACRINDAVQLKGAFRLRSGR
jgi:hypothetical protein